MKKGEKLVLEASPGLESLYLVAEKMKNRRRLEILWEDYFDIVKENEARKEILQKAKQKKMKLLAEVKFLRKKYMILSKNSSRVKTYSIKKKQRTVTFQFFDTNMGTHREIATSSKVPPTTEPSFPSTSTMIDLNQISMPNGEDVEQFQANLELSKLEIEQPCY